MYSVLVSMSAKEKAGKMDDAHRSGETAFQIGGGPTIIEKVTFE